MNAFIDECKDTILFVEGLLKLDGNKEWVLRYTDYAKMINNHMEIIQNLKKNRSHEWAPLYLYMTVSEAKGQMKFSLRYLGQDVAKLKVTPGKITISTKGFDETNGKFFECPKCTLKLDNVEWTSKEAANFRRHFSNNLKRIVGQEKGIKSIELKVCF